jgi:hypothetical protein
VGEKLVTYNFGTGTRGFAALEDSSVAVCILPGTELAFEQPVTYKTTFMFRANAGHKREVRQSATSESSGIASIQVFHSLRDPAAGALLKGRFKVSIRPPIASCTVRYKFRAG